MIAAHLTASLAAVLHANGPVNNDIAIPQNRSIGYFSIAPILILSIGGLALLLIAAVIPHYKRPRGMWSLLSSGIGGAAAVVGAFNWWDIGQHGQKSEIFDQIHYDRFTVFFYILIGAATLLSSLMTEGYLEREGLEGPEAYVLLLYAGTGAMLMAASGGLIMLFLGLEVMSIALYVLTAFHRRRLESGEGGIKYFVLGSFSSAIFLYGAALLYGSTGSLDFGQIFYVLQNLALVHSGVLLAGMALLIVGLGFKVAAVPFHFWTPDVYQGAPTPFTGYMAAVAKAAGFAGLLRILMEALPSQSANWQPIVWVLTVLTLVVGSVLAIVQKDLKRMMAYSSISQAGYVLIGLQAGTKQGTSAVLFYLMTYVFMIIGTFAVLQLVQGPGESRSDLDAIKGLARRKPVLALVMMEFMLAMAGIPLTSGFLAKFYAISSAIQKGQYVLGVIGMVAAVVAAFFYLRVVLVMYSEPDEEPSEHDTSLTAGLEPAGVGTLVEAPEQTKITIPFPIGVTLAVCAVFSIFAGVSGPVLDFARHATLLFS